MSYQVIARKWRPQKFDEVVFQDHVSRTLQNSIKTGRVSHAYLFSGPRGVGKTTIARILARSLNCEEGPTPEPCGVCENCLEIRGGTSFDVIEIDGASNRGIGDIKELRENVNFAPVKSTYKVYIIDEVHSLSRDAFNALLKTLEEPPSHVVFVFATTEYHKIPDTILSRCQKFFFKKIPVTEIVNHLCHITEKEGYKIKDEALYPVARAAGGSMRDAQSLLDQVLSFADSDGAIDEKDTLSILGIVPLESYIKIFQCIAENSPKGLMEEVERLYTMGIDVSRYVAGFLDVLRSLRYQKHGLSLGDLLGLSDRESDEIRESAASFYDDELSMIFRISAGLQQDLRFASDERIYLEMSLLDMMHVKETPSLASIIARLENSDVSGEGAAVQNVPEKKEGTALAAAEKAPEKKSEKKMDFDRAWRRFMDTISSEDSSLHFVLKPARAVLKGDTVSISYPDREDSSHYINKIETDGAVLIRKELSSLLGFPVTVAVDVPGGGENKKKEVESSSREEVKKKDSLDPAVSKLRDVFHGKIIDKGDN